MKYCSGKCGLLAICVLQLLSTLERQVFDFLGYMWLPILFNFLQLIAVIFGFFGAYQFRIRYILVYILWSFIWIGWNVFVVCFYLEIGTLRRTDEVLSLYTGAVSFWETAGPGCVPVYAGNGSRPLTDPYRQPRPARVDGCWLPYQHVEVVHAGLQLLLTLIGALLAVHLAIVHRAEDDSSGSKSRPLSPAFHIEYRPHRIEQRTASPEPAPRGLDEPAGAVGGPAPMTPRKIKRRSMTRNSQRSSGRSSRGSRQRSSQQRPRRHVNPVTQLMDSSSSEAPADPHGQTNPAYLCTEPRPASAHSSYSNYHGQRRPLAAVASDLGTTGTLSYSHYTPRNGPPPYDAVPRLTETSM